MICVWLYFPVTETVYENEEAGVVERVIQSEEFKEELQEIVAQQISDSLLPPSQPLYDLISVRQRYGQPDDNSKYGISAFRR